jgi:serine/threonine-protein kinase
MIGLVAGDNLLVSLLGSGGFGRVYLGLQLPLLMRVAVKLLSAEYVGAAAMEELRAKFEGEARALALVQHPHVVRLLQYGTFFDKPFLSMDYVADAVTLEEAIARKSAEASSFSLAEIQAILGQLLDGLGAAHELGVIHRDIKPANLMLQQAIGYPVFVRILDFGLAKFLDAGDSTTFLSGTPDYMAPEQIRRQDLGPWTDLYAVGTIAFELLFGRSPVRGETPQETLWRKLEVDFDPSASIAGLGLPLDTMDFLRLSLAADPGQRYRSACAMRLGMERALGVLSETSRVPAADFVTSPGGSADEGMRRWLEHEEVRLFPGLRNSPDED